MGSSNDFIGLREQIKENAARVFPGVIERHYHASEVEKGVDTSGIFKVLTVYNNELVTTHGHRAILTCVVDGREELLAAGSYSEDWHRAFTSLLFVLSEAVRDSMELYENKLKKLDATRFSWVDTSFWSE